MGLFKLNEDIHDIVNQNTEDKYQVRKWSKNYPKILSKSDGGFSFTKKILDIAKKEKPEKSDLVNSAKKRIVNDLKTLMYSPHKGTSDKFASYKYDD